MTTPHSLASDLDNVLAKTCELWPELRGRRIFITGATGFFGCWLLETFAWANQQLGLNATATVLTRDPENLKRRLPHLADHFDVLIGDIRNFPFPQHEFSHVIHAATESSSRLNALNPQLMFDTMVDGTRHCLRFAARAGARKFLFTSSGAVYGTQPPHLSRVSEDFAGGPDPLDRGSAYAEGKRAAELLCVLAAKDMGVEVKIARCFAFVGPYMKLDAHFAMGNFIRDHLHGACICVRGDGSPIRSYMYASDLMVWLWTILFRGEPGRAYNVGSEEEISIAQLAHQVAASGSPYTPVQVCGAPVPGSPAARYVPSTARAQSELGLCCSVPVSAAIERTLAWYRMQYVQELQKQ